MGSGLCFAIISSFDDLDFSFSTTLHNLMASKKASLPSQDISDGGRILTCYG
jgi:hypothetical protein